MKIIITAEEIINNHDWDKFCKSLFGKIDASQSEFALSYEQALRGGIVGAVEFYTVYQEYYDWQGNWVNEEVGKYLNEENAKAKVDEIQSGDGDIRNDKYKVYYHKHTPVFNDSNLKEPKLSETMISDIVDENEQESSVGMTR